MALTRLIIAHRPETIAGARRVELVREAWAVQLARAVVALESPAQAGVI
ncbi:hypothetical protein [Roseateles koreensis]|nr:hypothetical protein [Roseateles koreensis]